MIALAAGCVAGGAAGVGPEPAARLVLLAIASVVVAARFAWAGYGPAARGLAVSAACGLGIGLGAVAEARAWTPPGLDIEALERAVAAGEAVHLRGVLRRDAWVSSGGGVSLDMAVSQVRWRGRWVTTDVGFRATVAGDGAHATRDEWTRGRIVEGPIGSLRRPLPYRNIGTPDAERAFARRGVRAFATIKSASLVTTRAGPWWEEVAARARRRIRATVRAQITDPAAAATVTAILIGDRSSLDASTVRRLQHAGVYHVVAISGGNVGIWLALLLWIPRAAGTRPRAAVLWLAAGLLAFAAVVDGGPSVARAVMVAAVAIAARWWDVRVPAMQALAVAGGLQLAIDPLALHDAGCVLSFGAAGTLVLLASAHRGRRSAGPAGRPWATRAGMALAAILVATLAVECVLLPITARWFHVATAAGVLANVLAVPAMAVVQVCGLLMLPAAWLWPPIGDAVSVAAVIGVRVLLRSADVVSVAPWLVHEVPPPAVGVLLVYYGALAGACISANVAYREGRAGRAGRACRRHLRHGAPRSAALACGVLAASCLAWIITGGVEHSAPTPWTWAVAGRWQRASWPAEPWLLITMLDVGQGDATVVRFPSGRTWLVDAGGSVTESFDTGERITSPALWALGHRRLDRVWLTHAHPDHAAGLPAVIRRFRPREAMGGILVEGDPGQQAVSAAAQSTSTRQRRVATGAGFVEGGVRVTVLHPDPPDWERRRVRNDDSVVLWIRWGDVGVLLPGDIGQAVERGLAARVTPAPLTILRLAHHGSASSTSPALLDALAPVLAVASAARGNRFGHPSPVVVRRLEERAIPLLRTDEVGAVQVATNGRVVLVHTGTGVQDSVSRGPTPRAWWLARPPPSGRALPRQAADLPRRDALPPSRTGG